jgi:hypothetical protein
LHCAGGGGELNAGGNRKKMQRKTTTAGANEASEVQGIKMKVAQIMNQAKSVSALGNNCPQPKLTKCRQKTDKMNAAPTALTGKGSS